LRCIEDVFEVVKTPHLLFKKRALSLHIEQT
jgi:hypothetical protein